LSGAGLAGRQRGGAKMRLDITKEAHDDLIRCQPLPIHIPGAVEPKLPAIVREATGAEGIPVEPK
jgi:hypothetical protein